MRQSLSKELLFLEDAAKRLWDSCEDNKYSFPDGDFFDEQQYKYLMEVLRYRIDRALQQEVR